MTEAARGLRGIRRAQHSLKKCLMCLCARARVCVLMHVHTRTRTLTRKRALNHTIVRTLLLPETLQAVCD